MSQPEFKAANGNELAPFRTFTDAELWGAIGGISAGSYGILITTAVALPQYNNNDHAIEAEFGASLALGPALAVLATIGCRRILHWRKTEKTIKNAIKGLDQELEFGLYSTLTSNRNGGADGGPAV